MDSLILEQAAHRVSLWQPGIPLAQGQSTLQGYGHPEARKLSAQVMMLEGHINHQENLLRRLRDAREGIANSGLRVSFGDRDGLAQVANSYFLQEDDHAILEITISRVQQKVDRLHQQKKMLEAELSEVNAKTRANRLGIKLLIEKR